MGRSLYVTCLGWRKPVLQQNISSMIVETEKRVKVKTPDELLQVVKDQCLLYQSGSGICLDMSLLKDPRPKDTYQRLFQAEAVWQIINCNVLPKDYKETRVGEEESEIKQIVMVTDRESPSNDDDLE